MLLIKSIIVIGLLAIGANAVGSHNFELHAQRARQALSEHVHDALAWTDKFGHEDAKAQDCTENYKAQIDQIFNETMEFTDICLEIANVSNQEIEININENRAKVLNVQRELEHSLKNCESLNGTDFFECYVKEFDSNMMAVDGMGIISQTTLNEINKQQNSIEQQVEGCISIAFMNAKINTTIAYNDFEKCIQANTQFTNSTPNYSTIGTTPSWTGTTPSWNGTTPSWNETTPITPSWNESTIHPSTPSWNETTVNSTTPSWNETTLTTPSWNETTFNTTTPSWNETTLTTPSWNETTFNSTTPSWNETTFNTTTPSWNETTPSFNGTTLNSTTFDSTTPPWDYTTLPVNRTEADSTESIVNNFWNSVWNIFN